MLWALVIFHLHSAAAAPDTILKFNTFAACEAAKKTLMALTDPQLPSPRPAVAMACVGGVVATALETSQPQLVKKSASNRKRAKGSKSTSAGPW
jgi:hypothetical protein